MLLQRQGSYGGSLPDVRSYVCGPRPNDYGAMPLAWASLLSWQRGHVGGEGQPEVLEALFGIHKAMLDLGYVEEADALLLQIDLWLREDDLFKLQVQDVVFARSKREDGRPETAVKLGVATRGESAKTGMHQGGRVDHELVVAMLERRTTNSSGKLFNSSKTRYAYVWKKAIRHVQGLPGCELFVCGPPHSVRHTGPIHDLAESYRSLEQAQRRGRWSSAKSVLRYGKTHAWVSALARLPEKLRVLEHDPLGKRPAITPG